MTNTSRTLRRAGAVALSLALAMSTLTVTPAAAAKKVKLAKSKITVNVKKTKTVKIKNIKKKQVKKLTVKSKSKSIATAKAKGKTAIKVTGKKMDDKVYYSHSDYVGGFKATTLREKMAKEPTFAVENAVKGMLPKGPLGRQMLKKLFVYAGPEHKQQAQKPEALEIKY